MLEHGTTRRSWLGGLLALAGAEASAVFAQPSEDSSLAVVACPAGRWQKHRSCLATKARIEEQLHALALDKEKWYWALVGPDEWPIIRAALSKKAGRPIRSDAAITDTALRRTWLSLRWFAAQNAKRIRQILAHEWGHVRCACNSEASADAEAAKLLKAVTP